MQKQAGSRDAGHVISGGTMGHKEIFYNFVLGTHTCRGFAVMSMTE